MTPSLLRQIPPKLKQYNQFIMWKYEPKEGSCELTKVPYSPATGRKASPTESTEHAPWVSFEYVLGVVEKNPEWYAGIGFVLSPYDPFCFIDLDDCFKNPDDPELNKKLYQRHLKIYEAFGTYAEVSPSGNGAHLILEGSVPSGRNSRQKHIEIYSDSRFMTLTGNLVNGIYLDPRLDQQELLTSLYEEIGEGRSDPEFVSSFDGGKEAYTDSQIIEFCSGNRKFVDLFQGHWSERFRSQSEADLSLCSQIAMYTENTEQLKRIFMCSGLAATLSRKPDPHAYLHDKDWGILVKAFNRKLPTPDFSSLKSLIFNTISTPPVHGSKKGEAPDTQIVQPDLWGDSRKDKYEIDLPSIPPGFLGQIVQHIFDQMPRQVAAYALAGGMALMSGILGRFMNLSNIGLNQYFVMVGGTSTGKEGAIRGMNNLIRHVEAINRSAALFIGKSSYTGKEAILRALATNPSFCATIPEFGIFVERLLSSQARPGELQMQEVLLDLYNKSGRGSYFNGAAYSTKEKSIDTIQGPALSLIGDTVAENFYKHVSEKHVENGLFPRFSIIEYHGQIPYLRKDRINIDPPEEMVRFLAEMCHHSHEKNQKNAFTEIIVEPEAQELLDLFDDECTDLSNGGSESSIYLKLWSRAPFRALRTAGVVSGSQNYMFPRVTLEVAEWSVNFVKNCMLNMMNRVSNKSLGFSYKDNNAQYDDLMTVVRIWATNKWSSLRHYNIGRQDLHAHKIIPHSFISKMLSQRASFNEDKFGSYGGIKRMVAHAMEMGDLRKLTFAETALHRPVGDCYLITSPAIVG